MLLGTRVSGNLKQFETLDETSPNEGSLSCLVLSTTLSLRSISFHLHSLPSFTVFSDFVVADRLDPPSGRFEEKQLSAGFELAIQTVHAPYSNLPEARLFMLDLVQVRTSFPVFSTST